MTLDKRYVLWMTEQEVIELLGSLEDGQRVSDTDRENCKQYLIAVQNMHEEPKKYDT